MLESFGSRSRSNTGGAAPPGFSLASLSPSLPPLAPSHHPPHPLGAILLLIIITTLFTITIYSPPAGGGRALYMDSKIFHNSSAPLFGLALSEGISKNDGIWSSGIYIYMVSTNAEDTQTGAGVHSSLTITQSSSYRVE